ncbi:hypothetical protein [Mycolicibacterium sp. XJ879]
MLATFGLDRLEAGLHRDTVSATDVATLLSRTGAADVDTLTRADRIRQPRHAHESTIHALTRNGAAPDLPTRDYPHRAVNPEFQRTRHANRV